jgi:hypothetical protein
MYTEQDNSQSSGATQAAGSFFSFLQRNGGSQANLSGALEYQAAQARSGTQEITTPQQEAMKAWVAELAAQRQAELRELTTLVKDP